MEFKKWLNESSNTGGKTGLYPLGYGGVGLYPPTWYTPRSADAFYYLSNDERIYKSEDGGKFNIKHIPDPSKHQMTKGEGGLWNIKKI